MFSCLSLSLALCVPLVWRRCKRARHSIFKLNVSNACIPKQDQVLNTILLNTIYSGPNRPTFFVCSSKFFCVSMFAFTFGSYWMHTVFGVVNKIGEWMVLFVCVEMNERRLVINFKTGNFGLTLTRCDILSIKALIWILSICRRNFPRRHHVKRVFGFWFES